MYLLQSLTIHLDCPQCFAASVCYEDVGDMFSQHQKTTTDSTTNNTTENQSIQLSNETPGITITNKRIFWLKICIPFCFCSKILNFILSSNSFVVCEEMDDDTRLTKVIDCVVIVNIGACVLKALFKTWIEGRRKLQQSLTDREEDEDESRSESSETEDSDSSNENNSNSNSNSNNNNIPTSVTSHNTQQQRPSHSHSNSSTSSQQSTSSEETKFRARGGPGTIVGTTRPLPSSQSSTSHSSSTNSTSPQNKSNQGRSSQSTNTVHNLFHSPSPIPLSLVFTVWISKEMYRFDWNVLFSHNYRSWWLILRHRWLWVKSELDELFYILESRNSLEENHFPPGSSTACSM